jgi:hypothetical protein
MRQGTALVEVIARRFLAGSERLTDEMFERIRTEVSEFAEFDGPELWESVRASCRANIEEGVGRMARGELGVPDAIPPDARDLALLAARTRVPLAALLRAYRVGHALIWEEWFAAVERQPADPGTRRASLEVASSFLFAYVDRLSTFVTDEYTTERDRFMRSREQRRTQLVRDVLDGATPDAAEAMRELDYDLRLHHLAAVFSGPDPEDALRDLARALDAPHQLLVSLAAETAWAWLGRTREFQLPERLELSGGATLSIGDPAPGIEGFRSSHREARDAHGVALGLQRGAGLVRYDDVALESLVGADEARVRAFVARELRGLDGADVRSVRLRGTLRAYFASGQNAAAAAAMLGVHEHTVGYRLRTIEDRLGRPVTTRRAELEMALRLLDGRGGG